MEKNLHCAVCKKYFKAIGRGCNNKKYCSRECYKVGTRIIVQGKPGYHTIKQEKKCLLCGTSFIAIRQDKIFCTRRCATKNSYNKKPKLTNKSYIMATKLRSHHIPQDQIEILLGSIIGDGSLILQTNNFHRFSLCHSEKQLPYLLFKKEKLSSIFLQDKVNRYEHKSFIINGKTIPTKIQFHSQSISHPDLTNLYGLIYRNKKQYISRKLLNLLSITSLLIWYLDDGSLNVKGRCCQFCTHAYSFGEVKAIKIFFWQKYRIQTKIRQTNTSYNDQPRIYYLLHFDVKNTAKLIDTFKFSPLFNEIPDCMRYKVTIRPYIHSS